MAILLKIRGNIKEGHEGAFRENQKALCEVMSADHPGVICYHVDYPAPGMSEWTEIYANNDAFKAHLANEKGKAPLGAVIGACDSIICRCWGDPDDESKEILAGFAATYHDIGDGAFVLHPNADKDSAV